MVTTSATKTAPKLYKTGISEADGRWFLCAPIVCRSWLFSHPFHNSWRACLPPPCAYWFSRTGAFL